MPRCTYFNKYAYLVGAVVLCRCMAYNAGNMLLGQLLVQHRKLFFAISEFIGLSGMD